MAELCDLFKDIGLRSQDDSDRDNDQLCAEEEECSDNHDGKPGVTVMLSTSKTSQFLVSSVPGQFQVAMCKLHF